MLLGASRAAPTTAPRIEETRNNRLCYQAFASGLPRAKQRHRTTLATFKWMRNSCACASTNRIPNTTKADDTAIPRPAPHHDYSLGMLVLCEAVLPRCVSPSCYQGDVRPTLHAPFHNRPGLRPPTWHAAPAPNAGTQVQIAMALNWGRMKPELRHTLTLPCTGS